DDPHLLFRAGRARLMVTGEGEEELARAAALFRDVDPAAAAEAEIEYGEAIWQRGDRDGSFPHFERAASVVEPLPACREKAYVVGQVGRFFVLAGRTKAGLALVEEAIAMAEEVGADELVGDLLNTRGVARSNGGDDEGGIADLERSLELGLKANSPFLTRAYLNLGSVLFDNHGELERAEWLTREGLGHAERMGLALSQRWFRANLADSAFQGGLWDESLELAGQVIEQSEANYLTSASLLDRALIRLARGDAGGARSDAELCADLARQVRDPQALMPALAGFAFCAASTGAVGAARAALSELLAEETALGEAGRLRPGAGASGGISPGGLTRRSGGSRPSDRRARATSRSRRPGRVGRRIPLRPGCWPRPQRARRSRRWSRSADRWGGRRRRCRAAGRGCCGCRGCSRCRARASRGRRSDPRRPP